MKNLISILFLALMLLATGCKPKPDPLPTNANITLHFNNMVGSEMIVKGATPSYINALGQKYSFDLLKYYVSDVRLKDAAGNIKSIPGYFLIDIDGKLDIECGQLNNGAYTELLFAIGVDAETNSSSSTVGDLNVKNNMYWDMIGYTFFKHEGIYLDNANKPQGILLHLGTNGAYVANISLPLANNMNLAGVNKIINVKCDFSKVYNSTYDFAIDANHQSTTFSDNSWIKTMRNNLFYSFSVESIK
jgi:hypothetical protein